MLYLFKSNFKLFFRLFIFSLQLYVGIVNFRSFLQLKLHLLIVFFQGLLLNLQLRSELLQLLEFLLQLKFLVAFIFDFSVKLFDGVSASKKKDIPWLLSIRTTLAMWLSILVICACANE